MSYMYFSPRPFFGALKQISGNQDTKKPIMSAKQHLVIKVSKTITMDFYRPDNNPLVILPLFLFNSAQKCLPSIYHYLQSLEQNFCKLMRATQTIKSQKQTYCMQTNKVTLRHNGRKHHENTNQISRIMRAWT